MSIPTLIAVAGIAAILFLYCTIKIMIANAKVRPPTNVKNVLSLSTSKWVTNKSKSKNCPPEIKGFIVKLDFGDVELLTESPESWNWFIGDKHNMQNADIIRYKVYGIKI